LQVKVKWLIGDSQRFLTGELISEDDTFIKVRGQKDGTIFEIAKKTILELQRGSENNEVGNL
jgi:hypothetical protein